MPFGAGLRGAMLRAAFVPTSLSGCVLWLRADLGVTSSSGAVSQWNDQSGTGDANKNVTQATGANKPTLNTSNGSYSSKPTIDFNGTSTYLQSGTWASALSQPFTDFVVGHTANGASGRLALDTLPGASQASVRSETSNAPGVYAGSTTADSTGSWTSAGVFGAVFNGASTALYFNSHTSTGSGSPGTTGRTGTTVGKYSGGAGFEWSGSIAEIITYNRALNATEIT